MLSLLAAGSNARGQLATGDTEDAHHLLPCIFTGHAPGTLPNNIAAVEQVACGANHTLALLRSKDGQTELWGCGDGSRGQLGPSYIAYAEEGNEDACTVFRQLELPPQIAGIGSLEGFTVRLIAAGWETSYVALSHPERSDVLLSMGANDFGNLGVGASGTDRFNLRIHAVDFSSVLPTNETRSGATLEILSLSAGPHHTVVRFSCNLSNGLNRVSLTGWGAARHGQVGAILNVGGRPVQSTSTPHVIPVDSPEDMTAIALGNQHTVCLRSSGHLHALGSNRKDQLSGVESLTAVRQVGCTWNGTYVLLESGEVIATGSNTHSQLGRGAEAHERQHTLAAVRFPFALAPGQVSRLACGSEHALCILDRSSESAEREVWGWGWNEHGNLGTGGTDDVKVPVKIWPPPPLHAAKGEIVGDVVDVWAGCGTSFILVRGPMTGCLAAAHTLRPRSQPAS